MIHLTNPFKKTVKQEKMERQGWLFGRLFINCKKVSNAASFACNPVVSGVNERLLKPFPLRFS